MSEKWCGTCYYTASGTVACRESHVMKGHPCYGEFHKLDPDNPVAEQLTAKDVEIARLRGCHDDLCRSFAQEYVERAEKADEAWQVAMKRLFGIATLLGVDPLCEEPETCEQVITRMKTCVKDEEIAAAKDDLLAAWSERDEAEARVTELEAKNLSLTTALQYAND